MERSTNNSKNSVKTRQTLSRADKIKETKIRLKQAQNNLDKHGIITTIVRAGEKNYNVIQNFEVVKNLMQRRSARNYIERLAASVLENGGG